MKYIIALLFVAVLLEKASALEHSSVEITTSFLAKKKQNKEAIKKDTVEVKIENVVETVLPEKESKPIENVSESKAVVWNDSSLDREPGQFTQINLLKKQSDNITEWKHNKNHFIIRLKEEGIPLSFVYLALVQDFSSSDTYKKGPLLLEYTPAVKFGLQISQIIDERMYQDRSFEAAIKYIKLLNMRYKNWSYVAVAYLTSPKSIDSVVKTNGNIMKFGDFLILEDFTPHEKQHLEAFVKAKCFGEHTKSLTAEQTEAHEPRGAITVSKSMDVRQIEKVLELDEGLMLGMNPGLFSKTIHDYTLPVVLSIPKSKQMLFYAKHEEIASFDRETYFPKPKQIDYKKYVSTPPSGSKLMYHKVKPGDVLGRIAESYHVRVRDIQNWNRLKGTNIRLGQTLKIYAKGKPTFTTASVKTHSAPKKVVPKINLKEGEYTTYTVRGGDSPYSIAKNYPGVSAQNILDWNGLADARSLRPGMVLKIAK